MIDVKMTLSKTDYEKLKNWIEKYEIKSCSNFDWHYHLEYNKSIEMDDDTYNEIEEFWRFELPIFNGEFYSLSPDILKNGIKLSGSYDPVLPDDTLNDLEDYMGEIIRENETGFIKLMGDVKTPIQITYRFFNDYNYTEPTHRLNIFYKDNEEEFQDSKLYDQLWEILERKMRAAATELMEDILYEPSYRGEIVKPIKTYEFDFEIHAEISLSDEDDLQVKLSSFFGGFFIETVTLILPEKES